MLSSSGGGGGSGEKVSQGHGNRKKADRLARGGTKEKDGKMNKRSGEVRHSRDRKHVIEHAVVG